MFPTSPHFVAYDLANRCPLGNYIGEPTWDMLFYVWNEYL